MERKAWYHMAMVLLTQAKCEIVACFMYFGASIFELYLMLCLHAGICGSHVFFFPFIDSNHMCLVELELETLPDLSSVAELDL